jgi:hypothetical protein
LLKAIIRTPKKMIGISGKMIFFIEYFFFYPKFRSKNDESQILSDKRLYYLE